MRYRLEFDDTFLHNTTNAKVKITDEDAVISEYEMSLNDFMEALLDARIKAFKIKGIKKTKRIWKIRGKKKIKNPYGWIETPVLPPNCFKHIWITRAKGKQQVFFFEIPRQRRDRLYYETRYENVGHPRSIFIYTVRYAKITNLQIYAVKGEEPIQEETPLYHFPFPNVSENGVCMGGNQFPEIKNVEQLATMHNFFFSMPANHHFLNEHFSGIADPREYFKKLVNRDYPEDWLKPIQKKLNQISF